MAAKQKRSINSNPNNSNVQDVNSMEDKQQQAQKSRLELDSVDENFANEMEENAEARKIKTYHIKNKEDPSGGIGSTTSIDGHQAIHSSNSAGSTPQA